MELVGKFIEKKKLTSLREIARVGHAGATPGWEGMTLEVETFEYKGTDEEPHIHLYPANHRSGDKRDLITRVHLTDKPPEKAEDVHAIEGNPPVKKIYQDAIFEWSKLSNRRGLNNWTASCAIWDAQEASASYG